MFKPILFPITVILALLLSGCKQESAVFDEVETVPVSRRTVLVYMEARNNLSSSAYLDLEEMRLATIPDSCRLLVYRSIRGEDHPTLTEIFTGGDSVLVDYSEEASAVDPAQMQQVLNDVRTFAPSGQLGVVFWSHSSGWRQKAPAIARGFGLEDSWNIMSVTDLASVLNDEALEFIVFDTCFMGSVEVAYELRKASSRMVASVCEVPANGMPYERTVPCLFNSDTDLGLRELIDITVDEYEESLTTLCPSTLSLINLTALDCLIDSMKTIIGNLPISSDLQRFATSGSYRSMFFDLGNYIEELKGDPEELLAAPVMYERHTSYPIWGTMALARCSGLSVYVPLDGGTDYKTYNYNTLAWAQYLGLN